MTNQTALPTRKELLLLRSVLTLLFGLCIICFAAPIGAQDEDEGPRRLPNKQFRDARTAAAKPKTVKPPSPKSAEAAGEELIGVTFWRLTPATEESRRSPSVQDEDARLMIPAKKGSAPQPYHTARIGDDATFRNGELLWLGIEVPRADDCFVYVLDREQNADGSLGDPYLIFPTPTTPDGANVAGAGQIVYVPAPNDPLPYFRLERSDQKHIAERLTIIVSPRRLNFRGRLEEVDTDIKLLRVDTAESDRCDREWTGKTERLPARRDLSASMTRAEREARETRKMIPTAKPAGDTRRLLPTDLLPHTIYRVQGKAGQPVLVNVSLRIAE
ncbi:MAG TPA: hypothetical protein PKC13_32805 [Blastocatellia bacterium]|nr:hypothetical protein [Blastocatellia bacterium]HMV81910.1 hypothetical protein [Blastocatellia bacterium]HMX30406.1 hypothetical protein [Blastocatellia bacterium]HNG33076.1 hypothetical protein [Blastocatellia bacterium]